MQGTNDADLRAANIAVVRRYIDAINVWDFEVKDELLADDAVFEMPYAPPGWDRKMEGKATIMPFLKQIPAVIEAENLHDVRIDTLGSDPGEVIADYRSDMKMVIPVEYRNEYIGRFTVRDGRITRFAEYYDPCKLIIALGGSVQPATIEDAIAAHAARA